MESIATARTAIRDHGRMVHQTFYEEYLKWVQGDNARAALEGW
jgi:hypothetical protein